MFNSPFPLFDPFSPLDDLSDLHSLDLLLAPTPTPFPTPIIPTLDLDLFQDLQISSSFAAFQKFQHQTETDLAIKTLTDRVSALELSLALAAQPPRSLDRKYTFTAEYKGPKGLGLDRKYKWVSDAKASGDRSAKWVAEIKGVEDEDEGGVDRKYKWLAAARRNGGGDVKWSAEIKGKGKYAPVSRTYTWQSSTAAAAAECVDESKKVKEKKKGKCVQLVEIEESSPSRAAVAIRKAFAKTSNKGKRRELAPQDAALLIQMTYRAHLVRRAQVLRCLRSLAVAKAKLKELRALFTNFSYRSRIVKDAEERQRFSEKIIVLLLTVDGIEGPDYLVRVAKKSMIDELEAMLEVVDPQSPGKLGSMRRRKFDLPEGPISKEMMAGVSEVVQMLDEE